MAKCWSKIKYKVLFICHSLKQEMSRSRIEDQILDYSRAALNRGFTVTKKEFCFANKFLVRRKCVTMCAC